MTPSDFISSIADRAKDALGHLTGPLPEHTIFSEPLEVGDRTVITAATVERAGGFGFGGGAASGPEDADEGQSGGGGGGGGGSSTARPVAVIEITADGVHVEPIIDVTRIGVTALLTLAAAFKILR